jgi:hypothetical protein
MSKEKDPTTQQWLEVADLEDELTTKSHEIRGRKRLVWAFAAIVAMAFVAILTLSLLDKSFWPFFILAIGGVGGIAMSSPEVREIDALHKLELKHRRAQRRLGT